MIKRILLDVEKWSPSVVYIRGPLPCGWCWANGTFSVPPDSGVGVDTVPHRFKI
jgi:hypothetical protein